MPYQYFYEKVTGTGKYSKFLSSPSKVKKVDDAANADFTRGGTITSIVNYEELQNIPQRLAIIIGKFDEWYQARTGNTPRQDGSRSIFSQAKYKFFLDAPFEISNKCCNVMKKKPAHDYAKRTGRKPIIATMASESRLRTQKWLQNGCNGFQMKNPTSQPMSFWTEQDVLAYIKENNLPICSVYGDVVIDYESMGQVEGQTDIFDFIEADEFAKGRPLLKTTGCERTGCVACGFGCHLEKSPNRFEMLKETHPKLYDYAMNKVQNSGVTMKEAIDWINEHGNMNIKY